MMTNRINHNYQIELTLIIIQISHKININTKINYIIMIIKSIITIIMIMISKMRIMIRLKVSRIVVKQLINETYKIITICNYQLFNNNNI